MNQKEALTLLKEAIEKALDLPSAEGPKVMEPGVGGWNEYALVWDDITEWVNVTMGSSIFAGETGRYSEPVQPKIEEALEKIKAEGWLLEPITNQQLGIFKV